MLGSLFDTSAWIAVIFPDHPQHVAASKELLRASLDKPAVFCRSSQQSLLRLLTTQSVARSVGQSALSNREALATLDALLALPQVAEREELPGTLALWRQLASCDSASPRVWMDAYLAAFAITGDLCLVSADRDFRKYVPDGLNFHLLK